MLNDNVVVSCDQCGERNFFGRRYKCLICSDYDLCSNCHDQMIHSEKHPMQLILSKHDYQKIYISDREENTSFSRSLTCPLCSKNGFTIDLFIEHVNRQHQQKKFVLCPICFLRSNDLIEHLHQHEKNINESNKILPAIHQGLLHRLFDKDQSKHETSHSNRSIFLRSLFIGIVKDLSIIN